MKIKHWAGYGTVEAKKIKNRNFDLCVLVSGNHECGIMRNDAYDLFDWLIKRFDKSVADKTYLEVRPEVYTACMERDGIEYVQYGFKYNGGMRK